MVIWAPRSTPRFVLLPINVFLFRSNNPFLSQGSVPDPEEQSAAVDGQLLQALQGVRRDLPQQGPQQRKSFYQLGVYWEVHPEGGGGEANLCLCAYITDIFAIYSYMSITFLISYVQWPKSFVLYFKKKKKIISYWFNKRKNEFNCVK